jgi:hypothetical protein
MATPATTPSPSIRVFVYTTAAITPAIIPPHDGNDGLSRGAFFLEKTKIKNLLDLKMEWQRTTTTILGMTNCDVQHHYHSTTTETATLSYHHQ